MSPVARAEIVVDLAAISHNVGVLVDLVAPTGAQVMSVVKADGYGHGLVESARAARAGGATWLGVATLDEALRLRAAGDTGPVLALVPVADDDWAPAIAAGVDVTASSPAHLREIAAAVAAVGAPARVQLEADTGLTRGGAVIADWDELFALAREGEDAGSWRVTGLWSHFACSDEPAHPANDTQERAFRDAVARADRAGLRPEVRHLANSAAALLRPSACFDLVRCGLASYGLDPAPGHTPDLGLRPAMTARTRLALVKQVAPGDGVSYGHTWIADRATTVGLVPVGYGDGVPRHASNLAAVAVDGRRRPVRGRVCMDQFVVDLGGDRPEVGDEVVLFGPEPAPSAQDWAEACGTISYEIVTRIGGRFTRVHRTSGGPR